MKRWTRSAWLILTFVAMASVSFVGCSGKEDFGPRKLPNRDGGEEIKSTDGNQVPAGLKPIQGKGVATLKGTIKLVGDEPDYEALTNKLLAEISKAASDAPTCLAGTPSEKTQYSWRVSDGKVNNVFVWMRPADDKAEFFDVKALVEQTKGFEKAKIIDQPHCAFEPHALIIFPRYVDPANPSNTYRKPADKGGPPATGQSFIVKNSGRLNHNTSTQGDSSRIRGISTAVSPGSQLKIEDVQPWYRSAVEIKCSVHPWMKSWVWAFDHPFACVSGSKLETSQLPPGEFKIENIPAGVKLRVVAWHEEAGFLNGGEKGEVITLKEGDNTKDFSISYKK